LWGNFFQAGQISLARDRKQTGSRTPQSLLKISTIPGLYPLGLHLHQFDKAKDRPAIVSQVKSGKKGGVEVPMDKTNNELQKDTIVTTKPQMKDGEKEAQLNVAKTGTATQTGLLEFSKKSNVNERVKPSRSISRKLQGVEVGTINKSKSSTDREGAQTAGDRIQVFPTGQRNKVLNQVEEERLQKKTSNRKEGDYNLDTDPEKIRVDIRSQMKRISPDKRFQSGLVNDDKSSQDIIENKEIRLRMVGSEAQKVSRISPMPASEGRKKMERARGKYIPMQKPLSSFKDLSSWIRKAEAVLKQINELLPLLARKAKENLELNQNLQKPARIISESKNVKKSQDSVKREHSNYLVRRYQGNFHLGV